MDLEICSKCNGIGYVNKSNNKSLCLCPKCKGKGEIDWIEQVVGKKYKPFFNYNNKLDCPF